MDAENRLNEFRRERKRKETLYAVKKYISSPLNFLRRRMSAVEAVPEKVETTVECEDEVTNADSLLDAEVDSLLGAVSLVEEEDGAEDDNNLMGLRGITKYLTYFTLWVVPYILLIKVGFGAVYFCVTALLFIYFNTRTRPKLMNEPSAYSVFNQDCAPIEGAVSSEQLEKQLRSGNIFVG
uniref:SAYSvFN domain-containing protein 1 n=1 Tax=Lygus hesperus TaxID=30085 RepID=A0A0A9X757_LYGHE